MQNMRACLRKKIEFEKASGRIQKNCRRKPTSGRAGGKSGFTENGTGRAVRAGTGNVSSGDTKAAVCGSGGIPGGEKWIEGWRQMNDQVKTYESLVVQKKSSVETLKGQLNGKRRQETESDVRKKNETDMLLKEKNVRKLEIHGKNITHQSACDSLKKYFAAEEELREKYEVVGNLSRTANGSLTGSVKLDFETYVQRKYFRQIIQAANRRLAKMTSGGFILQCRELKDLSSQGQAGLDLDVYDLVTDSVRDVKSLSGGESFMAALSMALGLADIIQNTAGAVSLETMFVDEGFGSLDDQSRERAIRILKELAGEKGLVGIISHVNELKEQIDWKLTVTKSGHGSHARWII